MNTFAHKNRESRGRATTGGFAKNGRNAHPTLQLAKELPAATAQRALDESLNQSAKVQSQIQLQHMFNESPRVAWQRKLSATLSARKSALQPEQPLQRQEGLEDEEMVQRQTALEDEEPLQGKFVSIQREIMPEEEEPLQSKSEPVQKKENRTGLPDELKAGVENLSGLSMDDVRVHYNSAQPATVQALAYTQGTDIHIAPGQERHLPHEAWHAAQQKQGRVRPTFQMMGTAINDDVRLENEADVMGAKSLQMMSDEGMRSGTSRRGVTALQRETMARGATQVMGRDAGLSQATAAQDSDSARGVKSSGLSVSVQSETRAPQTTQAPVQMIVVRVRSDASDRGLYVSQLKIEGRVPTVVSGSQGDHTVAEGHLIFLLERMLSGQPHSQLAVEISGILDLIESEATAKYKTETGGYATLSSSSLVGLINNYKGLVQSNAATDKINAALEDLVEAFIRLWNKRAESAYLRKEGMTTGGGGGVDEKDAKKKLHTLANEVGRSGSSDELAIQIGRQTARMVDFVPKNLQGLTQAAKHLAQALEITYNSIRGVEVDYETVANKTVLIYAAERGLPEAAADLIDLYVITLLRGKPDYFDDLQSELIAQLNK